MEKYVEIEVEIIVFDSEDIIVTSPGSIPLSPTSVHDDDEEEDI